MSEGDYQCEVSEGERCHKQATQCWREPFSPWRVLIICCDECADGLRVAGYHFDEQATAELSRELKREAEAMEVV